MLQKISQTRSLKHVTLV